MRSLQERAEQSTKELTEVRVKLSEQPKSFEAERIFWINDKKTLGDTIVHSSTSEKQTENDRNSNATPGNRN